MQESSILSIPSLPLPFYLESGRTSYTPGEQHPNRRNLGVYDLIVVEKGLLHMGEESERWDVGPGQLLLLHPERYHYAARPCETETLFYWLHFQTSPSAGANTLARTHSIRLPQYWTLPSPSQTCKRFERLIRLSTERRSEAFWQEQTLFLELLKELDEARMGREGSRTLAVAEMAEAYIKQNYQSPLNNTKLSHDLHFHYNYLTRCMKEVFGLSPMDYLMQVRLEQAKLLLIKTDWSMARVAEEVGFEYAPYFSRCFSARNGISPLQFRKRYSK
jgi:AraC-like DNA-binding protein